MVISTLLSTNCFVFKTGSRRHQTVYTMSFDCEEELTLDLMLEGSYVFFQYRLIDIFGDLISVIFTVDPFCRTSLQLS